MGLKELQRTLGVTRYQLNSWIESRLFTGQPHYITAHRQFSHLNMYEGMLIKALFGVGLSKHTINTLMKQTHESDLTAQPNIVVVFDRKVLVFTDIPELCIAIHNHRGCWNDIHVARWSPVR